MTTNGIKTAEEVLQQIHDVSPWLEGVLPLIPGVGAQAAVAVKFADALEPIMINALEAIASDSGGSIFDALIQFVNHITPGMPNAPALTPDHQAHTGE